MNVSCGVIQDLLPLYAEDLASDETKELVGEHLRSCPACQKRLEELKRPAVPAPDGANALRSVKKSLRRRRWETALLAALLVFLVLLTVFARCTDKIPLPYEKGMIEVAGVADGVLTLSVRGANAMESTLCTDPDSGESTLLLQAWTNRGAAHALEPERESYAISPVPDRVLYGYGIGNSAQKLLYGEPMNGGILLLPRLVLGYYLLYAAALAALCGLAWLLLRGKKAAGVLRVVCFAALSYPVGHLLIKGAQLRSFFVPRDFALILAAAAAVWGLLTLGWTFWKRKKAEAI